MRRLMLVGLGALLWWSGVATPAAAQTTGTRSGSNDGSYYGTSEWLTTITTARSRGRGYYHSSGGSQSSSTSSPGATRTNAFGVAAGRQTQLRPPYIPEAAQAVLARAALGQIGEPEAAWMPPHAYGNIPPPVPGRGAPLYEGDHPELRDAVSIAVP